MNLVKFSVTNFRSITQASKIPISEITVLVGKNNEGKSNMLKALKIAMHTLRFHADKRKSRYGGFGRRNDELYYNWERDFPISLQERVKNLYSTFRLEFQLNSKEIKEFKKEIKSSLNGTLPLEIKIGKERIPKIRVIKKGKGAKTLNDKSEIIAGYIAKRIFFNYIPAVRTDQEAISVVNEMLSEELALLETNEDYLSALTTIKDLQTPILEKLSGDIKDSLVEFIPNINEVFIEIQESRRRFALRQQFEIFIDDGNRTNLEFKGDGVKSLSALALLKNISIKDGASLIAIEEPESHLHPGAIHILRDTIYELSKRSQVIVSTHNPLFIERENVKSNILIDSGKAKPAKNIKEIRDILGIKASDNLINASFVLVVEGEEDVVALKALLPSLSSHLSKAIKNNLLVIEKIGGAGNLSYKLSLLKNSLCQTHVLLDNDDSGRKAYEKAERSENLKTKDCTFIMCAGMQDSEFEDVLKKDIYAKDIFDEYGVNINLPKFNGNKKWSERMGAVFLAHGKMWDDNTKAKVKNTVAKAVSKNPINSLNEHKRSSIDALVMSLESLIEKI